MSEKENIPSIEDMDNLKKGFEGELESSTEELINAKEENKEAKKDAKQAVEKTSKTNPKKLAEVCGVVTVGTLVILGVSIIRYNSNKAQERSIADQNTSVITNTAIIDDTANTTNTIEEKNEVPSSSVGTNNVNNSVISSNELSTQGSTQKTETISVDEATIQGSSITIENNDIYTNQIEQEINDTTKAVEKQGDGIVTSQDIERKVEDTDVKDVPVADDTTEIESNENQNTLTTQETITTDSNTNTTDGQIEQTQDEDLEKLLQELDDLER